MKRLLSKSKRICFRPLWFFNYRHGPYGFLITDMLSARILSNEIEFSKELEHFISQGVV